MTVTDRRTRRRATTGIAAVAAALALAAPHSALAAPSATTFADRSGDAPAAIDATSVTVSSDAQAIVFTQKLRNVAAAAPLTASAPEYTVNFTSADPLGGRLYARATTIIGNAGDTRLEIYDATYTDGYAFAGTRTIDRAASTISLRFERDTLGFVPGLSPGSAWTSLTATNRYQQDLFGRVDTATAPAGTTHTAGG